LSSQISDTSFSSPKQIEVANDEDSDGAYSDFDKEKSDYSDESDDDFNDDSKTGTYKFGIGEEDSDEKCTIKLDKNSIIKSKSSTSKPMGQKSSESSDASFVKPSNSSISEVKSAGSKITKRKVNDDGIKIFCSDSDDYSDAV
jgi:hypothetical protein